MYLINITLFLFMILIASMFVLYINICISSIILNSPFDAPASIKIYWKHRIDNRDSHIFPGEVLSCSARTFIQTVTMWKYTLEVITNLLCVTSVCLKCIYYTHNYHTQPCLLCSGRK